MDKKFKDAVIKKSPSIERALKAKTQGAEAAVEIFIQELVNRLEKVQRKVIGILKKSTHVLMNKVKGGVHEVNQHGMQILDMGLAHFEVFLDDVLKGPSLNVTATSPLTHTVLSDMFKEK